MASIFCLSACDFKPVLQSEILPSPSRGDFKEPILFVKVGTGGSDINGHLIYQFRRHFLTQLRTAPRPLTQGLKLTVTLTLLPTDLLFKQDATILRTQTHFKAMYEVYHTPSERSFAGESESFSSFTIDSEEEFRNLSSKKSAEERVIFALAEEIIQEILVQLSSDRAQA